MTAQRLRIWEEIREVLLELHTQDGCLIAKMGANVIALPVELKSKLDAHVGNQIAILRTDSDFRVRYPDEEVKNAA